MPDDGWASDHKVPWSSYGAQFWMCCCRFRSYSTFSPRRQWSSRWYSDCHVGYVQGIAVWSSWLQKGPTLVSKGWMPIHPNISCQWEYQSKGAKDSWEDLDHVPPQKSKMTFLFEPHFQLALDQKFKTWVLICSSVNVVGHHSWSALHNICKNRIVSRKIKVVSSVAGASGHNFSITGQSRYCFHAKSVPRQLSASRLVKASAKGRAAEALGIVTRRDKITFVCRCTREMRKSLYVSSLFLYWGNNHFWMHNYVHTCYSWMGTNDTANNTYRVHSSQNLLLIGAWHFVSLILPKYFLEGNAEKADKGIQLTWISRNTFMNELKFRRQCSAQADFE